MPQSPPAAISLTAVDVHTRAEQHDKLLAYSRGLRYDEFVKQSARFTNLLRIRYAETRLGPAVQLAAACFPDTLRLLAVVSEEDPETSAVLPIVARLANAGPQLQLRILRDDADLSPLSVLAPELDLVSAVDEADLPQIFCFDEDWYLQAQWGPRPASAEGKIDAWLAAHPQYELLADDETPAGHNEYAALAEQLIYEMRVWYNSGLGAACLDEWLDLLRSWQNGDDLPAVEGNK